MEPTPVIVTTRSPGRQGRTRNRRAERGQATAEYALVMLAAAALAGLLLAWASSSGGIDRLLDAVMDALIDQVG
jgi:hypothetical protein